MEPGPAIGPEGLRGALLEIHGLGSFSR